MFVEEIAKLKLDRSYLCVPAERWQAGKAVACGSHALKAKPEESSREFFLTSGKSQTPAPSGMS